MPELPFNAFAREGLYLASVIACAAEYSNPSKAEQALLGYGAPVQEKTYLSPAPYPAGYLYTTETNLVVSIEPTLTNEQWRNNILGSAQTTITGIPGQVNAWFAAAAQVLAQEMRADILAGASNRVVTFVGNSLGGAICQIMYQLMQTSLPSDTQVYVFGCPRVGNADFANAFPANTLFRVENLDDPVPSLPPTLWAGPGSKFPIPGPGPFAVYQHGGVAATLDYQGYLENGGTQTVTQKIVNYLYGTDPISPHTMPEYVRRMAFQLPFTTSSETPQAVVESAATDIIIDPSTWESSSVAQQLAAQCKVEVFYSFMGEGFSEVYYSPASPADLKNTFVPAYVNTRRTLMTGSATALYARISPIGFPRQVQFWAPGLTYQQGKIGNIKGGSRGVPDTVQSNQYVGIYGGNEVQPKQALLLRLLNTGGYWTRLFLHAFPAEVIANGVYFPTPDFFNALKQFINFLKGPNAQWLSVSTVPNSLPKRIQVVSITANPSRGATIIYTVPNPSPPGYPFTVGQPVTVGGAGALEVGMNGRKVVISLVASTDGGKTAGIVVGGAAPIGAGPQSGQAYLYAIQQQAWALADAGISRLTTHKTGKVVFEPVGRKRNTLALRR